MKIEAVAELKNQYQLSVCLQPIWFIFIWIKDSISCQILRLVSQCYKIHEYCWDFAFFVELNEACTSKNYMKRDIFWSFDLDQMAFIFKNQLNIVHKIKFPIEVVQLLQIDLSAWVMLSKIPITGLE